MSDDASRLFTDDEYYQGEDVTDEELRRSSVRLGFELPESLRTVLKTQNGGTLRRQCLGVSFQNTWAADHIAVSALLGVGGDGGMDGRYGSRYMIREWGYPDIGVVFAVTPSAGHDTLMLDYRDTGHGAEPKVAYIDEDRTPREVAKTFGEFLSLLADCRSFE